MDPEIGDQTERPRRVAIVGTGLIGRSWGALFARAGAAVSLWDRDGNAAASAAARIGEILADLAMAGLIRDAASANARVSVAPNLAAAVDGADLVQESGPEDAATKAAIFADLDRLAPAAAILGSSASALPGSTFLGDLPSRDRAIVLHPANPPHAMPVVEIVPSPWHTPDFIARCRRVLAAVGQAPVVIRAEIAGFVMNRLQAAVINEAIALVDRGVVEPDDLDAVMKHSLGLRWAFMGPFETMDLNAPSGFLDYARKFGPTYATLGAGLTVDAPWHPGTLERIEAARRATVPAEGLAERQRWRDRMLLRILKARESRDAAHPEPAATSASGAAS